MSDSSNPNADFNFTYLGDDENVDIAAIFGGSPAAAPNQPPVAPVPAGPTSVAPAPAAPALAQLDVCAPYSARRSTWEVKSFGAIK